MHRVLLLAAIFTSGLVGQAQADVAGSTYTLFTFGLSGPSGPATLDFGTDATCAYTPDGGDEVDGFFLEETSKATGDGTVVINYRDGSDSLGAGYALRTDLSFGPLTLSLMAGLNSFSGGDTSVFFGYAYSVGSIETAKSASLSP